MWSHDRESFEKTVSLCKDFIYWMECNVTVAIFTVHVSLCYHDWLCVLVNVYTALTLSLRCTCPSDQVHVHLKCALACRDTDVHTVASLLKLYLRELPEPVVPWTQYQEFLDCTNMLDSTSTEVCVSLKSYDMSTSQCRTLNKRSCDVLSVWVL